MREKDNIELTMRNLDCGLAYSWPIVPYVFLQCVFFYGVKSFCQFDPLKMLSDKSIISQNIRLARAFNKNPTKIYI